MPQMQSPTGGSIVFVGVGLLVVVVGLRVVVVLGGLGVRVLRGVVLGVVVSSVVVVVSSEVVVVSSVVVVVSSVVVIVVSSVVVVVGAGEGVVGVDGTIGGTVGAGGPMGPSGPRPPGGPDTPVAPTSPVSPGGGRFLLFPVSRAAPPPSPQHQVPFLRIENIINYGIARHCTVHRPTLTGAKQAYRHLIFTIMQQNVHNVTVTYQRVYSLPLRQFERGFRVTKCVGC